MERVIKFYTTEGGNSPVKDFLSGLDDRTLAKVLAEFKLIETQSMVPIKYFKKLSGHDLLSKQHIQNIGDDAEGHQRCNQNDHL